MRLQLSRGRREHLTPWRDFDDGLTLHPTRTARFKPIAVRLRDHSLKAGPRRFTSQPEPFFATDGYFWMRNNAMAGISSQL
jgi:hypothetical protein